MRPRGWHLAERHATVDGAEEAQSLGLRLAAYCLDALLLVVPTNLLNALANLVLHGAGQANTMKFAEAVMIQWTTYDAPTLLLHNVCGTILAVIYYALLEGLWGASVGKYLCGHRNLQTTMSVPIRLYPGMGGELQAAQAEYEQWKDAEAVLASAAAFQKLFLAGIGNVGPGLAVTARRADGTGTVLAKQQLARIVDVLYALPHGVMKMSADIPDLVETSTNVATIGEIDGTLVIGTSQRSSDTAFGEGCKALSASPLSPRRRRLLRHQGLDQMYIRPRRQASWIGMRRPLQIQMGRPFSYGMAKRAAVRAARSTPFRRGMTTSVSSTSKRRNTPDQARSHQAAPS